MAGYIAKIRTKDALEKFREIICVVTFKGDLELFSRGGQFSLVPGRDKHTMWDRQPLRQFDRDRL